MYCEECNASRGGTETCRMVEPHDGIERCQQCYNYFRMDRYTLVSPA